jgi:hypothetical protein
LWEKKIKIFGHRLFGKVESYALIKFCNKSRKIFWGMKVTDAQLLPLVFRWLVKGGYEMAATALQMECDDDLSQMGCGLHKKKLNKIVKVFAKSHPGLLDPFVPVVESDAESSGQEEIVAL